MIPEEAIEVAAKSIFGVDDATWDLQTQKVRDAYLEDARNALEAAAPYMRGKAQRALGAVEALHAKAVWQPGNPRPDGALENGVCSWCGDTYPCRTIAAITTALGTGA